MTTYHPIDCGIQFQVSISNLDRLTLEGGSLVADFFIPHDEAKRLRVTFGRVELARTADEFIISVEDGKADGRVAEHFAYRLEGSSVFHEQIELLTASRPSTAPPLNHFQFVTGWTCLDVVSASEPGFTLVEAAAASGLRHHPTAVVTEVAGMRLQGYGLGGPPAPPPPRRSAGQQGLLARLFGRSH